MKLSVFESVIINDWIVRFTIQDVFKVLAKI